MSRTGSWRKMAKPNIHSPNSPTTANKIFSRRSGPGLLPRFGASAQDMMFMLSILSTLSVYTPVYLIARPHEQPRISYTGKRWHLPQSSTYELCRW
ncbi:hypothetical protein M434DRAFT_310601 [Hypoxylon sp. CO27-5]|nr:hypothetical protein M434DRAFT_310601 [Hypoxylon sp. CO27-5]